MLDCRCFMLLHDSTAWMIWRSVQPPRRLVCQILEFGLFQAGLWPRLLVAWHFNLLNYRVGHPLHDQIWWWFSWWYSSIGTKVLPTAVSSIRNMERNWCVDLAFVTFWYTMQGQAIWDKSVGIFTVWTFHEVMFGDDLLDMLDFACLEVSSMPWRMPWRDPRAEDGDEAVLWSNLTWVLLCKTSANQRQKKNWGRIHCRSVQNANTFPILSLQQPFWIQLENINCCAGRVALSYSPQAIDKVALHVSIAEYVTWLSTPKRCPSLHLVVRTTMPYLFFSLEKVINRTMKFHQVEFTRTLQRMDRKCDQDSEGYNMPLTCYNTLCPVGPWDYVVLNFWWLGFETRATTVPCLCVFLVLWALNVFGAESSIPSLATLTWFTEQIWLPVTLFFPSKFLKPTCVCVCVKFWQVTIGLFELFKGS